jgi:hypothetical protein
VQADPRFVDPAHGDFHLRAGSPAIDNANSSVSGWPSTDAEGNARVDDPGAPNTGPGPVTFADRGALEFHPTVVANASPIAQLVIKPATGTAPLRVHASASGSSDPDGRVVSYLFDYGDGTHEGPKPSPESNHVYAAGQWTASVTVTDNKGATATATANVVSGPVSIVEGGGAAALMTAANDGAPQPPADDLFMAPGVHPNPMRADGARIVFTTRTPGPTQVAIFDLAGRVVRQIPGDPAAAPGVQGVAFDGRGDDGQRLPGGVYYYQVRSPGAVTRGRIVLLQ